MDLQEKSSTHQVDKRNKKITIFIGDSIEDFYAAKENIKFLLKINSEK